MQTNKPAPFVSDPSQGSSFSIVGGTYKILASGLQTGNAFATIDMLVPPGSGPGPHSHANFQETFYVVEGEVEVVSEVSRYTAGKGSYVVIPKGGIVHSFQNKTDKLAHLLCTVVPSGLEEMFEEIGKPVANGEFLPPAPMDEDTIKKMSKVAEKYGQKLYPPDYLDK